jgi:hypothetical protein
LAQIIAEDEIIFEMWPPGYSPGGHFASTEEEITEYFCGDEASRDASRSLARQYRVMHEGQLLGCFALQADGVRLDGIERPADIPYLFAPAIKLARLGKNAVTCRIRRSDGAEVGIGSLMVDYIIGLARAVNTMIAVRYITLDALNRPELIAWYEREGFRRTNVPVLDDAGDVAPEVNMLLDLLG